MDCPSWCSTGEGSLLALPISAADGLENLAFVSWGAPIFHRRPTPISVPVIEKKKPSTAKGYQGDWRALQHGWMDGWMGGGSMFPSVLLNSPFVIAVLFFSFLQYCRLYATQRTMKDCKVLKDSASEWAWWDLVSFTGLYAWAEKI